MTPQAIIALIALGGTLGVAIAAGVWKVAGELANIRIAWSTVDTRLTVIERYCRAKNGPCI